jgi:3-hydroxyisobutyrate dehydrogenase-like beta-hydroxyacid dehydrogenase
MVTCRDQLDVAMPVAAAANEQYKAAKEKGHGDDDFAAVYTAVSKK